MHILVTNDDGVQHQGLLALSQAVRPFGKVTILGPDRNWSGGGHVKTVHRPLRVEEVQLLDGSLAFAADGAPSDCVALALLGFVPEPIDLVVSGINPYSNMGHDVTCSGTVTAAMESVIFGVPAIAFSLAGNEHDTQFHYDSASSIANQVVKTVLAKQLEEDMLFNVNIPNILAEEIKGFQITRQGMRIYHSALDERQDPRGKPYYWISGSVPSGVPDFGTDFGAIAENNVSITPLKVDLTDFGRSMQIRRWPWEQYEQQKPAPALEDASYLRHPGAV